jgi:hypothetical protein
MVLLRACSVGVRLVGRLAATGDDHRRGDEQEEKRAMHQDLSLPSVAAEP